MTTALGFGCNALLGPRSRAEGLRLLAAAYDAGIRHFDTARAYNYGDSEGLLGEFLVGRRDTVTVTTKFGILPMARVARMRSVIGLARRAMRVSPWLRRFLGRQGRKLVQTGTFDPATARVCLETSLRELRTDRIDYYLLHDCAPEHCETPGLADFLSDAVARGRIGRFGVGTSIDAVLEIDRRHAAFADVLQFENNVLTRNIERLPPAPARARRVITYKPVGGSVASVEQHFRDDPKAARRWSDRIGTDCADLQAIAALSLNYAVRANPGGIVLFSSTDPARIHANARAVFDAPYKPEQIDRFAALVQEMQSCSTS